VRRPIVIARSQAVLIACTIVFAILVAVGGWTWPLKLAAVVIPVAALLVS
jgi:hypothetical protein